MKVEGLKKGAIGLSLAVMIGSSVSIAVESNKDSKALMEKLNELNDKVTEQQAQENQLEDSIKAIQEQTDALAKQQDILDKQLRDKLSYRENISKAIQQTSNASKDKADQLAELIDDTTTSMKKEFGFPKDDARLLAIISTESDFKNLSANEAEAVGYTQITPACLSDVNKRTGWGYTMGDMSIAKNNLRVSWYFYNKDKVKYGEDKAIVAYNQGYRNLGGAVTASRGDSGSYLSKVTSRTYKYQNMIGDVK